MRGKIITLSDDLACRKTNYGIKLFSYFEDDGEIKENDLASKIYIQDFEIASLAVGFLGLPRMLDEVIGLYLEFMNIHGYEPDHARSAAVNEVLEGLDALEDIAKFEAEQ